MPGGAGPRGGIAPCVGNPMVGSPDGGVTRHGGSLPLNLLELGNGATRCKNTSSVKIT